MSSANGKEDPKDSTRSSSITSKESESSQQPQRTSRTKRTMRLPGMPPLGITSTKPLIGTPYSLTQPPFEYPFPTPSPGSAASSSVPLYIPTLEKPSQSPFPYAPALLPRGNSHSLGNVGVESLGLHLPMWRRSVSPPHPKFQPSRVEPPVPPGLKDKVKEKLQSTSRTPTRDDRNEQATTQARQSDNTSRSDDVDDYGPSANREDTSSRPPSPDVT